MSSSSLEMPSSYTAGQWRRELSSLIRLALPIAVVQLGQQLISFVDTAVAGRIGGIAIAAAGQGSTVFFVSSVLGLGVVLGIDPLVAQAFGAGDLVRARRVMWHGVYTAASASIPIAAVCLWAASHLESFGLPHPLAGEARIYMWARLPSLLPFLSVVALRAYLQAAHVTRAIVVSTVFANVFNLVADWLLALGDHGLVALGLPAIGLPALGVVGLGLASLFASGAQLVVLALAVRAMPLREGRAVRQPDGALLRDVARMGLPVGAALLAEVGIFSLVQVLAGGLGVRSAAAHQVAITFASISFSVCFGIGAATSVQVGRAVGAGDAAGQRRAGLSGMALGAAFMLLPGMVLWIAPGALARLMTHDPQVVPYATTLLRIAALFQLFDGIQAVGSGALRGAGVTRWVFGAHVLSHWAVGLPVAAGLAYGASLGVVGLWWGLTAGLVAVASAVALKFVLLSRQRIAAS